MDKPTYKDEVYIPTENEPWSVSQRKAMENGYNFFCETTYGHSNRPYSVWAYVKHVSGEQVSPTLAYEDLAERLTPPVPIWSTDSEGDSDSDNKKDAWNQYYHLVESFTKEFALPGILPGTERVDIAIVARAHERGVQLLADDNFVNNTHNVDTMRNIAKVLNEACDFVEEMNPEWAKEKNNG
jgi:hypothetical protein